MKDSLLNIFIDKLYLKLKVEQLGFNISRYANGQSYFVINLEQAEIKDFNHEFLIDNLSDYFFSLSRKNKNLLPDIFHEIISQYPHAVFTQLSVFPVFDKFRKGLDDCFPSLDCIFYPDDMALFLKNYKNKHLISQNYYTFTRLLEEITKRFKSHKDYEDILLHNFKVHSGLIKRANGNLIATRSWCIKNLNNTDNFEEFITLKDDNPLFHKVDFIPSLIFIDMNTVQSKYVINNAQGVDAYKNLFKSLLSILNSPLIQKELHLNQAEGQLVFDNKYYQLTLFSTKELNSDIIEEEIAVLLNAICEYFNQYDKKTNNFEGFVFKFFQFHSLHKKLVPLGKKSEKAQKI